MNWYLWFLVGWFLLSAVLIVANVGKPRQATTPGGAAAALIVAALIVAGIFAFGAR